MDPQIISLLLLFATSQVFSFNLSPYANQIFKIPSDQRTFMEQTRSSYFGFAVNLREDGIMISAPRAQTTLEMQRTLNETGAIYKCFIGNQSELKPSCAPFVFDNHGDVNGDRNGEVYRNKKKDQQWLGMSMDGASSPTDKFVVCAPRMITTTLDDYLMHGMCYVSVTGTSDDKLTEMPVEIAPLRSINLQTQKVDGKVNLFYKYGEMGVNVHISEDNEEILIGAPGVHQWKGTVVRYRAVVNKDPGSLRRRDEYSRKRERSIDHRQIREYRTEVPRPQLWNQSDDSYFGFAVTSGLFNGPESKLLYAASAPHAFSQTMIGEVYVFDIVDFYSPHVDGLKTIKKLAVLMGSQLGEFFGYSILAEDFNGDGFTDLVVGAPLYSTDGYHEHGRVYYFQNTGQSLDFELKTVLMGTGAMGINSRFGMSLGKIGDLDNDGYKDLAVGAPFEGDGAVYIFSGSKEGIRSKTVQKIVSGEEERPADGQQEEESAMFGMSISRGVDIDGNKYNDIVIGAPNAETVRLYRSYPVVTVIASVVPDKEKLAQNDTHVRVTACIYLESNVKTKDKLLNLPLRLKFKADPREGRALLAGGNTHIRTWELRATETKRCKVLDLSLKLNITTIFKPLEFELYYENLQVLTTGPVFCDSCVALNPFDGTFVMTKLPIMTECASEKCVADLRVTSNAETKIYPFVLGSSRIISMQYLVENFHESAYLPQLRITKSPQLQFAKIPPNCQMEIETLLCDVTRPLLDKDMQIAMVIAFDTTNMDGRQVQISAEVFSASDERNVVDNMIVDVIEVTKHSELESTGVASPQIIPLDKSGDRINITHRITLHNDGPSSISRLKVIIDIPLFHETEFEESRQLIQFNRIVAKARYNNLDLPTSWVQNDRILIQNPTESEVLPVTPDGFNATKKPNHKGIPDSEPKSDQKQAVQMLNEPGFHRSRRRRSANEGNENHRSYNIYTQRLSEVEETPMALKYSNDNAHSNRSIIVDGNDCAIRHQCVQLDLFVSNFRASHSSGVVIDVTVEMNLTKVATLFNENRDTLLYRLGIRVKKESLDELSDNSTLNHHSQLPYTTIVTTIPEFTPPSWVYIVSAVCGLLLITVITYGLYRCGFFRRHQREEMARLIRQKKLVADETDDDDD